jgi:hypothetical protein
MLLKNLREKCWKPISNLCGAASCSTPLATGPASTANSASSISSRQALTTTS